MISIGLGRVKLIDFGFAHHGLRSHQAVGTLTTMAPEVIGCGHEEWLTEVGIQADGYGPEAGSRAFFMAFAILLHPFARLFKAQKG